MSSAFNIPEGFVLVPREPTRAMLFAAEISKVRGYRDLYAAMISAAPTATQVAEAPKVAPQAAPEAGMEVNLCWRDATYFDSTPKLHVGDSAFEDWFQAQPFACQSGIKQISRDSYAAGMGDPLVTYAAPLQADAPKVAEVGQVEAELATPEFDPVWIDAHPLGTTWHGIGSDGDWYTTTESEYHESVRRGASIGMPVAPALPQAPAPQAADDAMQEAENNFYDVKRFYEGPAPQAVVGEASEQPDWPESWLRDGFNGCMLSAIGALQYLANNSRPAGGSSNFNSEHLFMIASELAITRERLLVSPAPSAPPHQGADALREDAERYRWLRDKSVPPHNFYISVPAEFDGVRYTPDEVDAGIDAARAALAQHQPPQQGEPK